MSTPPAILPSIPIGLPACLPVNAVAVAVLPSPSRRTAVPPPPQIYEALADTPLLGGFMLQPTQCVDVVPVDAGSTDNINDALYCGYRTVSRPGRAGGRAGNTD